MTQVEGYAPINIFIGKYELLETHIRLNNANIIYKLRSEDGKFYDERNAPPGNYTEWLIIEDGDFWPVMINLSEVDFNFEPCLWPASGCRS